MSQNTISDPISTFDLLKQAAREAITRNPEKTRTERVNLLLRKYHQVGSVQVPLPTLLSLMLIRNLDPTDRVQWLCETLYILHTQQDESRLFLHGDARNIEKARLLKHIPADQLPNYMIAVVEMLDMLEKKSQSYSDRIQEQHHSLISQLKSSPFAKPPVNGSPTTSLN